jgi:ADP-heptose:LPS heptosyltransferase
VKRILAVRLDSDGDVLLTGPAVRALAAGGDEVVAVVGPRGRQAAALLPGVSRVVGWHCGWVDGDAPPVTADTVGEAVTELTALEADEAVVFTSFHQSPLPTALVLRLAGVPRITGASVDFPGGLLDVRLRPGDLGVDPTADLPDDLPEPERALAIAARAGHVRGPGDDGCLRVTTPADTAAQARELLAGHGLAAGEPYVVLHPGASVPARAWPPERCAEGVAALRAAGHRVVVTGAPAEAGLTAAVAGEHGIDLGGATSFAELAEVLRGAAAVVVGNTGPAHLAAAVGTPVVSLFAPVVPARRWAPYGVPHVLLGDQTAPCRGTRARDCPVPGHPCLAGVAPDAVVTAVAGLTAHGE